MAAKTITVRFTPEQLRAVELTVRGELESLTSGDVASGVFEDLAAAHKKLVAARNRPGGTVQTGKDHRPIEGQALDA